MTRELNLTKAGDSKGGARPKKMKPQKRTTPTKKPVGKSASCIDSSTESEDDGDDGDIDDDDFLEPEEKTITMTLRGDPDFEGISLTKNPKMPPPRKRKRPAGEKVIIAKTWKPLVFTNKAVRQNPSKTLEVSKEYQDGKKRIVGRSIAVQTDVWKSRVQRRPRKLSPNRFNRKAWGDTPMAKIAFTRPLMTEDNSIPSLQVGKEGAGSRRFRPGALALAEIRHYMGMQGDDVEKYPVVSESEFNFLILHTIMKRVILEIGSIRLHNCAFEGLAYKILHYAGEHYLTKVYQDASMIATHARHTFVTDKDMLIARRMSGDYGTYDTWGYQRPPHDSDPIRLEASQNPEESRWSYKHQEWKSQAWKNKDWKTINKARSSGNVEKNFPEEMEQG